MVHGLQSNFAIFMFATLLSMGKLLKERICFHRSKFFPLSQPFFVRAFYSVANPYDFLIQFTDFFYAIKCETVCIFPDNFLVTERIYLG